MVAWTSGSCAKWLDLRDYIWLEYPKVSPDRLIMVAIGGRRDGGVGCAGEGKGGGIEETNRITKNDLKKEREMEKIEGRASLEQI